MQNCRSRASCRALQLNARDAHAVLGDSVQRGPKGVAGKGGNRSAFSNRWGSNVIANPSTPQSVRGKLPDQESQYLFGRDSKLFFCTRKIIRQQHNVDIRANVKSTRAREATVTSAWSCLYTDHVDHLWVDGLRDDVPVVGDVLHHLAQCRPLHLLPF